MTPIQRGPWSAVDRLAQAILDGRVRVEVWPHADSTGRPLGGHRIAVRVDPPAQAPEHAGLREELTHPPRRDDAHGAGDDRDVYDADLRAMLDAMTDDELRGVIGDADSHPPAELTELQRVGRVILRQRGEDADLVVGARAREARDTGERFPLDDVARELDPGEGDTGRTGDVERRDE